MSEDYDYIIVGQGLAGTCLAYSLMQHGMRILVIDESQGHSASKIAAGLFNPITGRNMVLTWQAEKLFSYLPLFYKSLQKLLNRQFFNIIPIYRPFYNVKEQNRWMSEVSDRRYSSFVKAVFDTSQHLEYLEDPFGGMLIKNAGYVNVPTLLHHFNEYLNELGMIKDEVFDIKKLELNSHHVVYKDYTARKVIFCEGPVGVSNYLFKSVGYRPVKGEILLVKAQNIPKWIISKGIFILPGNEELVVGATYDRNDQGWNTTTSAGAWLENKLTNLYHSNYKIVSQRAGIRPTIIDRRPVIGIHPSFSPIGIFNGLGTKGVSLAPYFAEQFVQHLLHGVPLEKEVDVKRFF